MDGPPEWDPDGEAFAPDGEEELSLPLRIMAAAGFYSVAGALLLAVVGLGAIAAGLRPHGDAAVAIAIAVGTGGMALGALVGVLSGQLSIGGADADTER